MLKCRDFVTVHANFLKIFSIFLVLYWKLCEHTTLGYYLDHGKIGEQQLSNIWPELNPPDAYSGRLYQTYVASSNLTDYDIRFLVSKVGSQELPSWLWYDNSSYSLTGIPLDSDVGVHQLFVLAMQYNETTSELLGAQTIEINVVATANYSYCSKGVSFVGTKVSLAVNGTQLNSTQRVELHHWFVTEFDLPDRANSIYFKNELTPEKSNITGCELVGSYEGNTTYSGPVLTISWLVGCNVSLTNASETISERLGEAIFDYSVYSWRVLNGNDSTLCFMGVHKSTGVSTVYRISLVQATSLSVQMDETRTLQSPMSAFGNITLISSGISPTHTRRSDQQILETTIPSSAFIASSVTIAHSTQRTVAGNTTLISSEISPTHTRWSDQQVLETTTPSTAVMTPSLTIAHSTHQLHDSSFIYLDQSISINSTYLYPSVSLVFNRTLNANSTSLFEGKSDIVRTMTMSARRTNSLHTDLVISATKSDVLPEISQSITSAQNSDPEVWRPLPTLNITSCEYLYYQIPQDTFWDREDGNNLTLQLLTNTYHELPNDSWIKLDPARNVIYGLPASSNIFGKNSTTVDLEYMLSATDSNGRAVNTSLMLIIHVDSSPAGQVISVEVEVQSTLFNLLQLVQDISEYLYSGDNMTMKILRLNVTLPNVYLEWSDCKAVTDVCDVRRVERTSSLTRINEDFVNPHFVIALVPDFVLVSARVEKMGLCLNEPPVARTESIHVNITCCGKFLYEIPRDLFLDQEDGDTWNLSLSIRYPSASRVQSETWVMLNNTSKDLEGVTILEEVQAHPDFEEFFIVARDSGRLEANVSVAITVQHPLPVSNYFVSLFLRRRHAFSTPVQEVFAIIEKLSSYFDGGSSDDIRCLSYSQENAVTVFTWSMADLQLKPCDSAAITNISKRLKASDGQVDGGFKSIMKPEFEVQFIFEERLGHCKDGANEQPTVAIPLHYLHLNLTYFEYKIPASTFNDLEDGNTPNLKLSLLLPLFEPLPVGSWIVLNNKTQVIYGLPDEDAIQAQPAGGFRYLLVGQDSGGKIASASVVVQILGTIRPFHYQITARLRSYLDASLPCVDHVVEFLAKLSTFVGEDKENIRIVSYNISKNYPADVIISWTNRSASFNACNHEIITERYLKFSNAKTGVTVAFSEILLPYFIVQDIKLEFLETCGSMSPNTPPVLLSPIGTLNIPVYQILRFQLPPMMFYDAEDGYTRNLTVFALDINNIPLNSSSWIQFDSTIQLLYGLPTSAVAKKQPTGGHVIHIIAMDTDSNRANSTIHIAVDDSQEIVSYVVKINMVVNVSLEHSDTDLVLNFLARARTFLGNSNTIVIDYFKGNTTLTIWLSTLDFLLSECNFSDVQEISDNLLFQKVENTSRVTKARMNDTEPSYAARPNQNFTRIMLPDFLISSVTEHRTGPCSNTAPIVLEPIPHFLISTRGLFSIALPLRTFYDTEDGFTSNLSLTLLSSSGHILPPNSWLQFNDSTDQIYGVITEEVNLNKNYTFVLNAEDRYGLKVNTSFTIEVASRLQNVGLKMNLIFKSNFSSIVPHVDIITHLLEKMASYYEDNVTLNVLSFERGSGVPSTDILSWSVTELDSENCHLQKLHDISKKARLSNNQPNEELKRALLPEFELLVIFEQRLGSCADSLNSLPTVSVPVLSLNISRIPTIFYYTIPRNVFHDPEDGDTRNLTLSLLGEDDKEIPRNSSVQFNSPLQMIYGIFTESNLNTDARLKKRALGSSHVSMNFILVAVDSGGQTVRSIVQIILGNNIISQNYEQRLTFISYLSSTLPDVMHLINFQEKLRKFEDLRDMQVAAYVRSPGYPVNFEVRFTNSTSNFNQSFCDFAEIARVAETFLDSSSNLKSEFTTSFLPEFVIQKSYIERFGTCESLPNSPPSIHGIIPVVNVSSCEILKYQIPENVFLDEDGNTRNLSLNLEYVSPNENNVNWISFDDLSQTIYGVPSLEVVANQPSDGYVFRLTATDSRAESVELNLSVFVRNTIVRNSYTLSVNVQVPSLIRSKDDLVLKTIEFVKATKRYLSSSSTNDVHVIDFRNISQSLLKVTWSNCSLRYKPCDLRNIEEIRQATIYTGTLPQPRFIQSLAPAFIVDSVRDEMLGQCLNQRPVVVHELESFNLTLCDGLFQYSIPYNTFFDAEDGYTPNLTLSVLSGNFVPLSTNYWLTLDQSQTVLAYPNVDALETQPESGYDFLISAKDSHGMSTNVAIKVLYEVDRRHTFQSTYEVTFVLQAQFTNTTHSVEQIRVILQTLAGYMGGGEKSIRVHSFLRSGVNSTTSFFTWSNCSFHSSGCDLLGIVETSKRLKSANGQILDELLEAFRPEFVLKFVFEQRLGACVGDTNVRPKAKQALYQISVEHFCGLWQFKIPTDFFSDAEDGGTRNLTLSLKTFDSMEIASDSWIQLDQESQTLFGFPILSNSSTSELFILIAADLQGKLATMNLEILFNKNRPNVHYAVLVEMSSFVGEELADVYHLKKFVERLAPFLKSETRSVLIAKYERRTTAGISSRLSVTWTNCSIAVNTCDQYQINILREKLNLVRGKVDMSFSQSMLPYFVPNLIILEKYGFCRNEAMKSPPRLVQPIGRILAYSGVLLRYSIPDDSFVDDEDGNALNLSLVLQFTNKVPVPSSYWLKFDNISLLISGVLMVENSWKRSFRLAARDQHGNEVADTFEVLLERRCPENLLGYQIFTEVIYTGDEESLNAKFLRKLQLYFQPWFSDTNFTILSSSSEVNDTFVIVWSHVKTCGACLEVNATVQALSENFTDDNGTVLPEFKNVLLPEFIVVNISEHKCVPAPGLPITLIKGGKDERWELYVVPIVVLLIFLLFSFIFFICRGFLFPYESKKEEVILDESPVSEIHVTERIRPSEMSIYNSASTTIINEGYLGNDDANNLPEIFLDKRVSPSKSSLPQDLSPVPAQDVESAIVPEPPLYSDAVLHLGEESGRKHGERRTSIPTDRESPIEMREIPIIKRKVMLSSEDNPVSEKSELDARLSTESVPVSKISQVDGRRTPREDRIQAARSPLLRSKPDDTWNTIDYEGEPIPARNRLRLPTPPEVGMLRLPPLPKPLTSPSSPSSLANPSSLGNAPISPPSSAYSTPLLTPSYSQTTVNNTYNVRQVRTPPEIPPYNYSNPPAYTEYPYGTPIRERTELGIQSPISYATPIRERMQLGVQSPLGFPIPQGRVPYVDHRQPRPPVESRPSDLHDVLGQLRHTVNRELNRRNEVDKYMDLYLNQK